MKLRESIVVPSSVDSCAVTVDDTLRIQISVSPPKPSDETKEERYQHLLAPASDEYWAANASVVVADTRCDQDASQAHNVLRDAVANFRFTALVIGAVTYPYSALVWIRDIFGRLEDEPTGYAVEIRSAQPGPAELYPSVLYTWLRWWADQSRTRPSNHDHAPRPVPRPPEHLTALVRETQLHLTVRGADINTSGDWGRALLQRLHEPFDPDDPLFR